MIHKQSDRAKHGVWQWLKHHRKNVFFIGASILVILLGVFLIWVATLKVPAVTSFADRKVSSSTKIYDRTGTVVLYDVHANIKRTVVTSDQISTYAKRAIVAIEDKNFYNHGGIELSSIIRASLAHVLPFLGTAGGGSTITQQLVKNTLLTQQHSISRKVKEWVLAIKLERVMTKDEILTTYLNEAPYGGTIYGIEEASQSFFGVPAKNLDLAQAAYLAAIPNAPSYYSPYGKNRAALDARKNLVLKDMIDQGVISQAEYDTAINETVSFLPEQGGTGKALHFVEYIRQYLDNKYGEDMVNNGGLKVITTLDWDLQQKAEEVVYQDALSNEKQYGASNSALVAIDPKTGNILSMVGSRNYFDKEIDGAFNVATAGRQPGSSFKPIVYSRAFEKGFLPETVLFDIPTQFGPCDAFSTSSVSPCYAPSDYDNKWLGPISLRDALAQSRNVPAVQLLSMVGLPDALETAKRLGITTLDRDASRYGLTLVLGGGEVSLLDMTSVYSVFANEGIRNPVNGILEVDDASGNVLEKYAPGPQQVMDPNATRMLSSVLSDNTARTPLFGPNSFFYFGSRQVAGKTGTTNDDRDAWVFGYTPSIAVGVWSGNNDNTPMSKGSAISGPAWRSFMDYALTKVPYDNPGIQEPFNAPDTPSNYASLAPVLRGAWAGGQSFFIDGVSGKLATDLTPDATKKEIVIPDPHNILYWVNPSNPTGPVPTNPASDSSQYGRWEQEFQAWIADHPSLVPPVPVEPTESDDVHTLANKPVVSVVSPAAGVTLGQNSPITIQVNIVANYPLKKIDWYLNNVSMGSTVGDSFSFVPADNGSQPGINQLRIVATDQVYNEGEITVPIVFQ